MISVYREMSDRKYFKACRSDVTKILENLRKIVFVNTVRTEEGFDLLILTNDHAL